MKRLTRYLAGLFLRDAIILFGVVCVLLWLVNCLRSFDVVAVKGQNLLTLALQALLTMPPLALTFAYVCIGIGVARALQGLQNNRELHIIHTSYGLGSLWRAGAIVAAAGMVFVLLLSNIVEPLANRRVNLLQTSIAADLVSSTLKPKRFTQVTPGVVLLIGGRSGNGEITDFFADDRRDPRTERTYIARSARVARDGDNYMLELRDGSLQYTEQNGQFSQISFARYDLSVERLTQAPQDNFRLREQDSISAARDALQTGQWTPELQAELLERQAPALSVLGICLLMVALLGFPSGRRSRFTVPMEALVMLLAFAERGVSSYSPWGPATGGVILIIAALLILVVRARPRMPGEVVPA
ncbi:MAG: LptF/LptG family permease [Devosia sp.]|jgi:lipopolysaccharide export system permease protein|nr:LptF/LptG family permease [Devosia sp.]